MVVSESYGAQERFYSDIVSKISFLVTFLILCPKSVLESKYPDINESFHQRLLKRAMAELDGKQTIILQAFSRYYGLSRF